MTLHIDWASHKAAAYACTHWHYSGRMPAGKTVKMGAWEHGRYIGAVIFGMGSGNATNGTPYGLSRSHEVAELARVALRDHEAPVSQIVSICLRVLRKYCPGIRLIVSLADPYQGHRGGIYQAGNWLYMGKTDPHQFFRIHGRIQHPRGLGMKGLPQTLEGARRIDPNAETVMMPGKHRYVMPLDKPLRRHVSKMAKPYPDNA